MRIAVIGDVHDQRERLAVVLELLRAEGPYGLVVLPGDLGRDAPFGPLRHVGRRRNDASLRDVVTAVGVALNAPVAFVPGNHDMPDPPDTPAHNVDGRTVEIAGLRLVGLGGAGPHRFGFPYEWSEDRADAALRAAAAPSDPIDLLLCHAPPRHGGLDRTASGEAVGSAAVAEAIVRLRPRLFVCGHIHEAWGVERLDGVPCLNAGSLGEPYGRELGWRVDWEPGGPRSIVALLREGDATRREERL